MAYRAVVNSGGGPVRGNAVTVDHQQGGSGRYTVAFDRDVSGCVATATLTDAQMGFYKYTAPPGRITLGTDGPRIAVRTFGPDGSAQDLPFSVIAAC